jgi:hypothetical protein
MMASKNRHIHPDTENNNWPIEVKNNPTGLGMLAVACCIPVALAQRQAGNNPSGSET